MNMERENDTKREGEKGRQKERLTTIRRERWTERQSTKKGGQEYKRHR